ncbi:MAG: formimidoylglutamase [Chitinophagaceae bacterium]|nr:formimidoylglutamase [Chitinophagaceae bacterium]
MSHFSTLADFLSPVNLALISNDEGYRDGQIGKVIEVYEEQLPDLENSALVIVGCGEQRGSGKERDPDAAPDAIRSKFYELYHWHKDVPVADLGNIKPGATLNDTYAALKTVVRELTSMGKRVVILGGSHDLTLAQYHSYADDSQLIEVTCADARIDLNIDTPVRSESFLMEMLTGEPNFIRHYNHVGFQSYYVHPHMLETMDKLRFDCYRVGRVRENIEEIEPVIRNSRLFSFDISAIANAYAPCSAISPNGLTGEEACILMQYAGMSPNVDTIGIYGFSPENDRNQLTAMQISQMLWYLIDGTSRSRQEAMLEDKNAFFEYNIAFGEVDAVFLQSKRTGRWWMQLPDKTYIACSAKDYLTAGNNEIPERWLRAQERT